MIKGKKSPLYALSRKVKTVPPTGVVSRLKFRKKSELRLFLRWIESSSAALKRIKSPSKKEIKDLDKGSKGGGLGLLALLGICPLASHNKNHRLSYQKCSLKISVIGIVTQR